MSQNRRSHILIVEDDPFLRTLYRYLLEPHFELCITSGYDEAMVVAGQTSFDLLLLDINLGESRTGLDVLQALRYQAAYREVPALACSAYAQPEDAERFLSCGFDAYLAKPFTRDSLLTTLLSLLPGAGSLSDLLQHAALPRQPGRESAFAPVPRMR